VEFPAAKKLNSPVDVIESARSITPQTSITEISPEGRHSLHFKKLIGCGIFTKGGD